MWKAQTGPVRPSKALRLCSAPLTARMGLLLAERAPRVGRDAALVGTAGAVAAEPVRLVISPSARAVSADRANAASQVRAVVNEECGDRLTYELCHMPEFDH